MPHASSAPPAPNEPAEDRITWRDVWQAVFFPPQDEHVSILPGIRRAEPAIPQSEPAPIELTDLDTPGVIHYPGSSAAPVEGAGAGRIAVIGIGAVLAVFLVYLAESALSSASGSPAGLLIGMAALIWLGLLMFEIAPPDGGLLCRGPVTTGGGPARPLALIEDRVLNRRLAMGLAALALSAATYFLTAGNRFTTAGIATWMLSIILWLLTVSERDPGAIAAGWSAAIRRARETRPHWSRAAGPILLTLGMMALAAFFRFYRLDAVPNEMTSDHVEKLLDAYRVSQGEHHVFFTNNAGREAIQFYLIPLIARLPGVGMTFLALKLTTALEALALIPLMIVLGREIVDRETGLYAAALLAISWWHTLLGRLGLRIVLTPLIMALILMVLARSIRTGSRRAWIWAGIWLGIGMYAYQALRIAPLVAIAACLASVAGPALRALAASRAGQSDARLLATIALQTAARQGLNLLFAGLIAAVIFVPMLRVWHDYPQDLWNRVINRTTSNEVAINGTVSSVLADNYRKALGMFNVRGDSSWFSAVPGAPLLDRITGGLFILGLLGWMVRLKLRRDPVDAFLIAAGLILLLPSALAVAFPIENPSATRGSGTIPIVFVLAAWPLALIRQRWSMVMGRLPGIAVGAVLIATLIGGAAYLNFHIYFDLYATSYRNSALNPGEVAAAIREQIGPEAPLDGVWLQGWPFWHDYRAIGIEAGDLEFDQAILDVPMLTTYLNSLPERMAARPLVFIVHPQDVESQRILQERFPAGELHYYRSATAGRDFILFVVRSG